MGVRSLAAASALLLTAGAPPLPPSPYGFWVNPHNNVVVRAAPCGANLCGRVAWASADAREDAREGGTAQLVGVQLLRNYRPASDGRWAGTVFVPDMGRSFSSTVTPLGGSTLKVQGCLVGGFFCRSQLWRRVDHVPAG